MAVGRLQLDSVALLVVDMQERLLPVIHDAREVTTQAGRLIDGARVLRVPVLMTEQNRKGLGATVPELADRLDRVVCSVEKFKFSAYVEPIRDTLTRKQTRSVVVCGVEAHVCVMQTCLDLVDAGYFTAVATDAVGSRRPRDRDVAVQRMVQAGVAPMTVESALFELMQKADSELFRALLDVIKQRG